MGCWTWRGGNSRRTYGIFFRALPLCLNLCRPRRPREITKSCPRVNRKAMLNNNSRLPCVLLKLQASSADRLIKITNSLKTMCRRPCLPTPPLANSAFLVATVLSNKLWHVRNRLSNRMLRHSESSCWLCEPICLVLTSPCWWQWSPLLTWKSNVKKTFKRALKRLWRWF